MLCKWAFTKRFTLSTPHKMPHVIDFEVRHFPATILAKKDCFLSFERKKWNFTTFDRSEKICYFPAGKIPDDDQDSWKYFSPLGAKFFPPWIFLPPHGKNPDDHDQERTEAGAMLWKRRAPELHPCKPRAPEPCSWKEELRSSVSFRTAPQPWLLIETNVKNANIY